MARKATKSRAKPKAQRKSDSRWITVKRRFDYRWPSGAITHWSDDDLGEHRVRNEVADFAVGNGYAVEGKLEEQGAGETADSGSDDAVAQPNMADADRSAGGETLDPDAG
jgi:hypothetical protein